MLFYDSFCIYPCDCYVQFRGKKCYLYLLYIDDCHSLVSVNFVAILSYVLRLVRRILTEYFTYRKYKDLGTVLLQYLRKI